MKVTLENIKILWDTVASPPNELTKYCYHVNALFNGKKYLVRISGYDELCQGISPEEQALVDIRRQIHDRKIADIAENLTALGLNTTGTVQIKLKSNDELVTIMKTNNGYNISKANAALNAANIIDAADLIIKLNMKGKHNEEK